MSQATEYLCVDAFIRTAVETRALGTAFEIGLIDCLLTRPDQTAEQLGLATGLDPECVDFLLGLLLTNGVIRVLDTRVTLSEPFLDALRFRDILQAKVDFANLVAPDFLDHFTALLNDSRRFMEKARLFRLFDYTRCFDDDPENREATRRWVRFTTALTRYEARASLDHFAFQSHKRMMDVGGNSGEFVLQICKRHRDMQATVIDLPVVCRIGREHVAKEPEACRISFHEANALKDPLPGGFDLVSFKSVLHDWPEAQAEQFIMRAAGSLQPGGTFLIYEREQIQVASATTAFSMIPMLLFFRYFRSPAYYVGVLAKMGFVDISVRRIMLEMPFFLVSARRPG